MYYVILTTIIWLIFSRFSLAKSVFISEVGWMGTEASFSDEWFELYNDTNDSIYLKDWSLHINDEKLVVLESTISAKSFYLIEKSDDNVVSNLLASETPKKWSKAVVNTGGVLKLINAQGQLVDIVSCPNKWCAGTSSPKASMELNSVGVWITSSNLSIGKDRSGNNILGTPGALNFIETEADVSQSSPSPEFEISILDSTDNIVTFKIAGVHVPSNINYYIKVLSPFSIYNESTKKWLYNSNAWSSYPILILNKIYKAKLEDFNLPFNFEINLKDSHSNNIIKLPKIEINNLENPANITESIDNTYVDANSMPKTINIKDIEIPPLLTALNIVTYKAIETTLSATTLAPTLISHFQPSIKDLMFIYSFIISLYILIIFLCLRMLKLINAR